MSRSLQTKLNALGRREYDKPFNSFNSKKQVLSLIESMSMSMNRLNLIDDSILGLGSAFKSIHYTPIFWEN